MNDMGLSSRGAQLIQKWEGYHEVAYPCSAGVWTIGWGHTRSVEPGDTCTRAEAEEMFEEDVEWAIDDTAAYLLDAGPRRLTQNEFDALVSWVFNIGTTQMKSSTLRKRIQEGDYDDVPAQLRRWNKVKGEVSNGLVNRREEEVALWLDNASESGSPETSPAAGTDTLPAPEDSLEGRVLALEQRVAALEEERESA